MSKILTIGSLNVDLINYVKSFPKPGETIFTKSFQQSPGGKGNNLANNIAKIGCKVNLVGAVGNDGNGLYLKKNLEKNGISSEFLITLENELTGIATILVDDSGENFIVVNSGANQSLKPEHINDACFDDCSIVVGTLESPIELLKHMYAKAKQLKQRTVLNLSPLNQLDLSVLDCVDDIIVNKNEFDMLVSLIPSQSIENLMKDKNIDNIICTMSAEGVRLLTKKDDKFLKGTRVKAIDTAGAGDAFLSGYLCSILKGNNITKSIETGMKYGAYSVQHKGCQVNLPLLNDIA